MLVYLGPENEQVSDFIRVFIIALQESLLTYGYSEPCVMHEVLFPAETSLQQ